MIGWKQIIIRAIQDFLGNSPYVKSSAGSQGRAWW